MNPLNQLSPAMRKYLGLSEKECEMTEKQESLREILIRRDGCEPEEADELIEEARQEVRDGANPEEVLAEHFGLEPDYIFDLIEL